MDKTIESGALDIIDLGAATAETKGPPGAPTESIGEVRLEGISPD
jgi:hypothetical protein